MKSLKEYVDLIPKVIKNADKIMDGILTQTRLNFGHLPDDEQDEIIRRRAICAACPFMSENAKTNAALNYKTDRFDEHCIQCSCNIILKTASMLSNCGLEIHNASNPDNKIPLKWEAYIKH